MDMATPEGEDATEWEAPNAAAVPYRCRECGANMAWDPQAGALGCSFCGSVVVIGETGGAATTSHVEHSLSAGLAAHPVGLDVESQKSSSCQDCGAAVSFGIRVTSTRCDFCGSAHVLPQEEMRRLIRPQSLVPFVVAQEGATEAHRGWLGKLWFRPSDLMARSKLSDIAGVYVPFWTFDALVDSSWTAQSGTYYYVTESYTARDSSGKSVTRTRQVRKTRWRPAWGDRRDSYDDVLVCASRGLPEKLVTRLETFDTKALVPYAGEFLAGFKAEEYAVDLDEAWQRAVRIIEDGQYHRCASDVPGDTQRFLQVHNSFSEETFKHVLLPVWIAAYRYKDQVHRFLVNGQTGEVTGTAPWSWWKISAAVIAAFIAAIVALWLYQLSAQVRGR